MSQRLAECELACAEVCQKPEMCPQRSYLSVPRELPCSSCQTGTAVEVCGGRAGWCPGRGSSLQELSAPCSGLLPTPSCIPGHQHLACHRLGAMGNGTSRWQSALQRSLGCPQRGEAPSGLAGCPRKPWPFCNCSGDRKLSHGTCFLRVGRQWPRVLCCFLFRPAVGEGALPEAGSEGHLSFLSSFGWQCGLGALPGRTPLFPSSFVECS